MLSQRLNQIIDVLGTNTTELAATIGFDNANISRIRNGRRVPDPTGSTADRLLSGLWQIAEKNDNTPALLKLADIPADASKAEREEMLRQWLFDGWQAEAAHLPRSSRRRKEKVEKPVFRLFSQRLSAVMDLAEMSNIRLSQQIHADPSLISRYRNGMRTPQSNPELAERLFSTLLDRIERLEKLSALAELMHLPEDAIDEDAFVDWMYDPQEDSAQTYTYAENLLESFDTFPSRGSLPLPSPKEAAPEEILSDSRQIYTGIEGIRTAVLRFLGNACKNSVPELLLYSDENQGWMTGDRVFLMKWASLMNACVKNGTKIRIIHNVDRNLEEMNAAIQSWLPLYMSGMIESFYCAKPRNPRFAHTIFLAPGTACIEAFHITGMEAEGIYSYHTDPSLVDLRKQQFLSFLSTAHPLLQPAMPQKYTEDDDVIIIQKDLTIATMSEELVDSFCCDELKTYWKMAQQALLSHLKKHSVSECVPPVSMSDSDEMDAKREDLPEGGLPVERVLGVPALFYTKEQYERHLADIRRLSQSVAAYHFYAIPETPFENVRLAVSFRHTKVSYTARPEFAFGFSHPLMCRAFWNFANGLLKTQNAKNRE